MENLEKIFKLVIVNKNLGENGMKPGKSGVLKTSRFFSRGRNKIAEINYVGMLEYYRKGQFVMKVKLINVANFNSR